MQVISEHDIRNIEKFDRKLLKIKRLESAILALYMIYDLDVFYCKRIAKAITTSLSEKFVLIALAILLEKKREMGRFFFALFSFFQICG